MNSQQELRKGAEVNEVKNNISGRYSYLLVLLFFGKPAIFCH